MSIFSKSSAVVNADDLQELLSEKAVENVRLEFKSEIPDKDETLKKLSSFANTFGGYLVVGARANRDGRLVELCGVQLKSNYKQTIMQWCFEGAAPPLTAEVSDPIRITPEKVVHVIFVPESDVAPHFLN
jgi:predicted HTH transcriptional regulator